MAVPQQQLQQPIGQLLIAKGVISEDQLRIATQEQSKSPQPLGRLLVRLGFLSEATIRDVLSENLGQESVDLSNVIVDSAALHDPQRGRAPLSAGAAVCRSGQQESHAGHRRPGQHHRAGSGTRPVARRIPADHAARQRIRHPARHRPVLRFRAVHRRHPARDRTGRTGTSGPATGRQRIQPAGGAPDRCAAHRGGAAERIRHPLRTGKQFPAYPLPRRRRAASGAQFAQEFLARDGGAPESDERHEHRRDARTAGWTHLVAPVRPPHRFPCGLAPHAHTARIWYCASWTGRKVSCRSTRSVSTMPHFPS